MNVYDFDNTIYKGESAVHFFFFCLKHDFRLIRFVPLIFTKLIKYKLCLISGEELTAYVEKYASDFFLCFENLDKMVSDFWDRNMKNIKDFYIKQKTPDDIILSASFSFLLEDITHRLGVKKLVCSVLDRDSRKITQLCFRENKVNVFKSLCPDCKNITFYTDSLNDKAMIDFAEHAYFVKGNKIKKIKKTSTP